MTASQGQCNVPRYAFTQGLAGEGSSEEGRTISTMGSKMIINFRHSFALAAVMCAGLSIATAADAKTFKWANSGDVSSMDPYARQETFLLTFNSNIYDPLIRRDKNL